MYSLKKLYAFNYKYKEFAERLGCKIKTCKIIEANKSTIKYNSLSTNADVSKISVIGVGMKSQSGVAQKMFQTLASKHINILAISTSEIKISVLIEKRYSEEAVKSLHEAYKLS